jgi:hypothetical protein
MSTASTRELCHHYPAHSHILEGTVKKKEKGNESGAFQERLVSIDVRAMMC